MRRDIEFTSDGDTVRGWLYIARRGRRPVPGGGDGRRLVLRQGDRPAALRGDVRATPASPPSSSTTATSATATARAASTSTRTCRSRTTATRSPSPRRSRRSTPERIGVWGLSYSGGHSLVLAAVDSADQVRRVPDPGRRGLPQHAAGQRHGQLPPARAGASWTRAANGSRPARTSWSRTSRWTPATRSRPGRSPRGYDVFLHFQRARGAELRLRRDPRVGRPADVLRRPAVPAPHRRTPRPDDRRRERRHHAVGRGDRRLQPPFPTAQKKLVVIDEVRPPGPVQQQEPAGAVRHGGDRVVRRAAAGALRGPHR